MVVISDETHFQYVLSALGVKQTPPPSGASSLMTGASSGATGSEKLPSLISHVKDILPHLGDGFIEVGGKLCMDPLRGGRTGEEGRGGGGGREDRGGGSLVEVGKRIPGI